MKKVLFIGLITLLYTTIFSQIPELKSASDKAKDKIKQENKQQRKVSSPADFVNPFIGTGGHGHTYPGATAPFGMMQLSPDTRYDGWDGCSGYHFSDSIIYGFSHTHLSGTGVSDLADILVVPQQHKVSTDPLYRNATGYGSLFSHAQEKAEPGFYSVKLLKNNIDVRLTTSDRCGMHEYIFNDKKGKKFIVIDLTHRDEVLSSDIKVEGNTKIVGHRHSKSWAKNQQMYFHLETNVPFTKYEIVKKLNSYVLVLEFSEETSKILLKTGISAVDLNGASSNLAVEMPDWNFDFYKIQTKNKWNKELGKIDFWTKDKNTLFIFYTALYHTFIAPTLFSDVDQRYLGNDGKIHTNSSFQQYSVFSLWDTYRTTHPLFTLIQRKRTEDFIASFQAIYKQTGKLPMWELLGNETDCMIGYHSVSVITDAYRKGIRPIDGKSLLEAMIATSNYDELGKRAYEKNAFLSTDVEPESVSKTLEYAYNDWCIAMLAKELGETHTYNRYLKRSYNFLNVFDPQTKFMRARRSGIWFTPFNPSEVNFNYTEANSWQYSLAAPQHISVLRNVLGGNAGLEKWLDELFTTKSQLEGRHQVDITGLIGQYAHGNEPSHHMAYMYNYTHAPHKTQERVDEILKTMYSNQPDGLSGNEDCGQMSAWYVMSAMGIYPVCPGNTTYSFGRPIMEEATIYLENGQKFILKTKNLSDENKYIQEIYFNGKPYNKLYIEHNEMMRNGELEFVMGSKPNLELNSYESDVKEAGILAVDFVPVPYFTNDKRIFDSNMETEIKTLDLGQYTIRYTTDGSEPNRNSSIYTQKLKFEETTLLKAKAFHKTPEKEFFSPSVSMLYTKKDNKMQLKLKSKFSNQYAASGEEALIDGLRGGNDFRSGDWQGFEGVDVFGEITVLNNDKYSEISFSFLQDERSWIFLPSYIQIEYSEDGKNFKQLDLKNTISPLEKGVIQHVNTLVFPQKIALKVIRFKIKNIEKCPKGHISEGGTAWLFLDEIWLE